MHNGLSIGLTVAMGRVGSVKSDPCPTLDYKQTKTATEPQTSTGNMDYGYSIITDRE